MLFNYTDRELDLLARIMRAEALDQGNLGMLPEFDTLNFKIIN